MSNFRLLILAIFIKPFTLLVKNLPNIKALITIKSFEEFWRIKLEVFNDFIISNLLYKQIFLIIH